MSEEAKKMSIEHQKWIVKYLKEQGGTVTYEKVVLEGEKHHCDTLGAQLKILKGKKAIDYKQMFLMYPTHKDEVIKLVNSDFDPEK